MPPKFKFAEGEKVLCFHGPLIYEAKCLKATKTKQKQIKYLIHYAGWNKNWDEWVPQSRVLKYNDANLERKKQIEKAHESLPAKSKRSRAKKVKKNTKASTSNQEVKTTTKRKRAATPRRQVSGTQQQPKIKRSRLEPNVETGEGFLNKVEVKIEIPEGLKPWLVDDWDVIGRQRKLALLPAMTTVDEILEKYIAHRKSSNTYNNSKGLALSEVVKGIREYFNVTLGTQLLYKLERPQYADILQEYPNTPMSKIYGSIHLLRLFVKLGSFLAYTPLNEENIQLLTMQFQDFLRYLVENSSTLFSLENYYNAPPEYYRQVQ